MIKVGDILIARDSFLKEHNFPKEERKFRVVNYEHSRMGAIETFDGQSSLQGYIDFYKHFYIETNINIELRNLLDLGIEFSSFEGRTVDGKTLRIEKENTQ